MFSHRLSWSAQTNRISILREQQDTAGVSFLDLTVSNPTDAGLDFPVRSILEAFQHPEAVRYTPDPAGLPAARAAVSAYYASRGDTVHPERVLLTASTSEAYSFLFQLLADPGDEVLVPRPSYPLFEYLASLQSVHVRTYPLRCHEGWFIDLQMLERSLTERTRAIVLVNPNNPTGSFVKQGELEWLTALCAANSLALISDEVFADYAFPNRPAGVESLVNVQSALTFCLSGLSKVSALPQMKLGWIVTGGPPRLAHEARQRLELIADTYLSVSAPVQYACAELLDVRGSLQTQIRQRTSRNWEFLEKAVLGATGICGLLPAEGGWYATLQAPRTQTEEEWILQLLEQYGVLVQPGFFYDFESEAYLILSLLTPEETFREGVGRILAAFSGQR